MVQSLGNQVVSTDSEQLAHELSHSQTVELDITIPDGSQPGDVLSLEVNGQMLEVAVPEGAVGGSIVTIAVPADNDASATSEGVSAEGDQDEKAVSPTSNTVELEITIPEGSNPGDILSVEVNGEMLEVTVPEGATGGTVITIDVPTDDANASPSASSPHAQDDTARALGENKATTPSDPAQAGHEVVVDAAPAEKPGTEQDPSSVAADPPSTAETSALEQKEDVANVLAVEPAVQPDVSKPEETSTQDPSSVAADPPSTEDTPALEQKEDVANVPVVQPDVSKPAEEEFCRAAEGCNQQ